MADRDIYWNRFGPLLLESMLAVFLDELNTVRVANSLSELTTQDILDKLVSEHDAAMVAENAAAEL